MIIYRCVNPLCHRFGERTEKVCGGGFYRTALVYAYRFITHVGPGGVRYCNTPAERDLS